MLPQLPKKIKRKEADFGLWFKAYDAEHNLPTGSYELKQTEGDSIPFSCVDQLQIDSALRTQSKKGNLVRVERGTVGTADYLKHREEKAYIVIKYPSLFVIIDINVFLKEKEQSKRKSLTSERACAISTVSMKL